MQHHEHTEARAIIERAIGAGYMISVNDGEEFVIRRSRDCDAIMAVLFSTEADWLTIRDGEGKRIGFIMFVYGNGPGELASDYTDKPEIEMPVSNNS